jgi:hypothetical protein
MLRLLVIAALLLAATPALAVDLTENTGFVVKRSEGLDPGKVMALENGHLVVVQQDPARRDLYVVRLTLLRDDQPVDSKLALLQAGAAKVFNWREHPDEPFHADLDAPIALRDISFGTAAEPLAANADEAQRLARGKRFMLGNLELIIDAPELDSFRADVVRVYVLESPVTVEATDDALPQLERHDVEQQQEDYGWVSGSLHHRPASEPWGSLVREELERQLPEPIKDK